MDTRNYLIRFIMGFVIMGFCLKEIIAKKTDFVDIMKNVDDFIKDSQKVITQLNCEIEKSNITLDRIASDSEKMDLLSGEEEKEIDELESQLGHGGLLLPGNVKLREEDSPPSGGLGKGFGSGVDKTDNNSSKNSGNVMILNKDFDSKNGGIGEAIKAQNDELNHPVKGSAHEIKILGNAGNGSTVCIILRPYDCIDSTTKKPGVNFSNYDPFMDPPMKGPHANINITNGYFGTSAVPKNSEGTITSSVTVKETNTTIPQFASPVSTIKMAELGATQTTTAEVPHTLDYTSNTSPSITKVMNTASDFSSVKFTTASPETLSNTTQPLTPTVTTMNSLDIKKINELIPSVKHVYFQLSSYTTPSTSVIPQNTTTFTTTATTTKLKKNTWKLFGKGKKTKSFETTVTQNSTNSSKLNSGQNNTKENDKNKNGTVLVLVYNIEPGDKNNSVFYNIESMSIIRNVSLPPPTITPSNYTNNSSKNGKSNIISELFNNVAIHGSNTPDLGVENTHNTSRNVIDFPPNTIATPYINLNQDQNNESGVLAESSPTTLRTNEAIEVLNSLKSEVSTINISNPNSLSNLATLISDLKNIILKGPNNSELKPQSLIATTSRNLNDNSGYSISEDESNSTGLTNQNTYSKSVQPQDFSRVSNSIPPISNVLDILKMFSVKNTQQIESSLPPPSPEDIPFNQPSDSGVIPNTDLGKNSLGPANMRKHNVLKRIIFLNLPSEKKKESNYKSLSDNSRAKCYIKGKVAPFKEIEKEIKSPLEVFILDPDLEILKQEIARGKRRS